MTFRAQGMRAWLLQRLSAVYLAIYMLVLGIAWLRNPDLSWQDWRAFNGHPLVAVGTALFFAALLVHAWVGVRDVLVDYVPHSAIRLVLLIGIATLLVAMAIWSSFILLSVVRI